MADGGATVAARHDRSGHCNGHVHPVGASIGGAVGHRGDLHVVAPFPGGVLDRHFPRLAPRRGSTIIVQGKAAEGAALGTSPPPISLFSKLCWPGQHNFEKREVFILRI